MDLFAKLNQLLESQGDPELLKNLARAQAEEHEAPKRKKKKRKGKKKKAGSDGQTSRSRSPSPGRGHWPSTSPLTRPPARSTTPPSARLEYHTIRPLSASADYHKPDMLRNSRYASGGAGGTGAPLRPMSAYTPPSRPFSAQTAPILRQASPEPGPEKSERTAPKYTANSLKQPELGTYPGKYQSPPWRPNVQQGVDPMRQELQQPIMEGRFKHVLAVPAHVLAKSLYHPDSPSATARVRQLQQDLKVARMDRKLAFAEKHEVERQLKAATEHAAYLEQQYGQFSASQKLMDEQVTTLQKAVRQLTFERDQLAEQVKALREASREHEVAGLRSQLDASQAEVAELKKELRRALQLAAG